MTGVAMGPFPPPDEDFRFLAIDFETANADMASICQIGVAAVSANGVIYACSAYIDPRDTFDPAFTAIHGLTAASVHGAPDFATVLDGLLPLLSRHYLFQHSTYEQRAVAALCDRDGYEVPALRWLDSVTVARRAWPEFSQDGGHGLANLRLKLGLDFLHHDAGNDAWASARIVQLAEARTGQEFPALVASRRTLSTAYNARITLDGADGGPLAGQIAVFTGALAMSREDAARHAAAAGITVRPGVTRQTTLVIVGDQDLTLLAGHTKSTKHRKAEELAAAGHPIRIIGEAEFLALIEAG